MRTTTYTDNMRSACHSTTKLPLPPKPSRDRYRITTRHVPIFQRITYGCARSPGRRHIYTSPVAFAPCVRVCVGRLWSRHPPTRAYVSCTSTCQRAAVGVDAEGGAEGDREGVERYPQPNGGAGADPPRTMGGEGGKVKIAGTETLQPTRHDGRRRRPTAAVLRRAGESENLVSFGSYVPRRARTHARCSRLCVAVTVKRERTDEEH